LRELSIVAGVNGPRAESGLTLLWLSVAAIALVALFVCAAGVLATVEFVYRRLIAAPIAWLLARLAASTRHG